jgi:hypothetical protein
MFIPIPRSVGQLTGWKAVAGVIVIVGIIGLSMWASFQPHTIASGTWELNPGKFRATTFQFTESGKIQAEFEQTAGTSEYMVMLVTDSDVQKLTTAQAPDVQPMLKAQGTGKQKIRLDFINAGKFAIVALTPGDHPVTVKYTVTGSR